MVDRSRNWTPGFTFVVAELHIVLGYSVIMTVAALRYSVWIGILSVIFLVPLKEYVFDKVVEEQNWIDGSWDYVKWLLGVILGLTVLMAAKYLLQRDI